MQVARVDILADLNMARYLLDDLSRRINGKTWELVTERSTSIRLLASPIIVQFGGDFSENVSERLAELVSQMRSLSQVADKARFTSTKDPQIHNLLSIVDDQKETVVLAISEIKQKLGENDGV